MQRRPLRCVPRWADAENWVTTTLSSGPAEALGALHLAETKAVLVGILRGMVAIELVIRDALAFEHRQYMETNVVDHLVVPGDHQSIAFEAGFAELRSDA